MWLLLDLVICSSWKRCFIKKGESLRSYLLYATFEAKDLNFQKNLCISVPQLLFIHLTWQIMYSASLCRRIRPDSDSSSVRCSYRSWPGKVSWHRERVLSAASLLVQDYWPWGKPFFIYNFDFTFNLWFSFKKYFPQHTN